MSGIRAALGYAGSEVHWIAPNAYATVCGNAIRIHDLATDEQFQLTGDGSGIACFATNTLHQLLVYADKSAPPRLHVYQFTGTEEGCIPQIVLETGAAELDITAVAISWDGERIASASSDPDRKLSVWDWTNGEVLTSATLAHPVSMISFNPYDSKRLCTTGTSEMHLWETEEMVDSFNLISKQCSVPGLVPNTHAWCPLKDSIYMGCAGGEIALFHSKTGEPILSRVTPDKDLLPVMSVLSEEGSPIRSMAVNREALVVAGDAGHVRWFLHPTDLGAPLGEANDVHCGVRSMCSLSMGGPNSDQLVAGSSEASLFIMEVPPSAGGEAEPEKLGDYHLGRVTAAVPLSDTEHFATCGEDGTLRVWSSSTCRLVAKRQFGTVQLCLASSENSACIAMGSESGIVRVLNTFDLSEVNVAYCSKLHKQAVTHVAFSPTSAMMMSYSAADGRMFICTVVGSVVRPMGFLRLPGPPPLLDLGWAGTDEESSMIIASLSTGELMSITPPAWGTAVPDNLQFGPRDYAVRRVKIEGALDKVAVLTGLEAPAVIGVGPDLILRRFQTRRDAAFWGGMAGRMIMPEEKSGEGMLKPAGAIHAMRGGAYVAIAGLDGSVKIISSNVSSSAVTVLAPHDNFLGGASAVAMNLTGKFVLTGGADGSVFISRALPDQLAIPAPPAPESGPVYDMDTPDETLQLDEIESRAKKDADKLHKDTENEREAVRKALTQLRKIFTDILAANKEAPELEQLGRKEFIVDEQMYKQLEAEGLERVLAIKKEIELETLRMKLLRERILKSTREQMEVRSETVVGIKNPELEVSNFALNKKVGGEGWKLRKALFLRKVEMKMQRQQFHINGDLAYRCNFDDNGDVLQDKRLQQLEVQDEELLNDTATAAATDSNNLRDMMYSDLDLHCHTRKITQSLIMTELIREAKQAYNSEFKQLQDRKIKDSDKIADLNGRIEGCAKELLKINGDQEALDAEMAELFHVNNNDQREHDDLKFEVSDSEVSVEKYVSPEEAERRAREAQEEADRQAKAAGDGSVQRALTMMMGGTLERPDDGAADFTIERPAFLDADPKTWTEEQFKEAKEFEAKQKAAAEEMAKKVQTIETELKTLKVSVEDTCLKFDEAIGVMIGQKQNMDSQVYQMEFRVIRLLNSVDTSLSFADEVETRMMREAEQFRLKKDQGTSALTDTRHKVDDWREKVEALVAEDKAMEKSFKKDFAGADQFVPMLLQLFRRRIVKAGTSPAVRAQRALDRPMSAASSVVGHAQLEFDDEDVESLAPFPGAGTTSGNAEEEEPPLDRALDCPPALDNHWWDQLVSVRAKKLELEAEIRTETSVLQRLQRYLHKLSAEDEQLRASFAAKNKEVEEFRSAKARAEMDLEIPMTLRQGQIETDAPSDTVSDLSHAVLLNRRFVEDVNAIIRHKGGKKVSILTAIKDFKKGSYELEWTNAKLDREAEDLVEKTKELQLLRVTKGLQEALKRGDDDQATPQENTNLEALIRHNVHLHEKNVKERERKLVKIMRTCREKQLQNYECQHQIQLMQTRLAEQARIEQSQRGTGDITPAKRMKSMVTHKRLKDISKAQAEEIQMLRAEVERLNLRTYPSFVEQTPYYPDEETMI